MKLLGLLAGLSLLAIATSASAGMKRDYNGNCYYWYQDSMGNTHVQGNNSRIDSMLNSTIDRFGNQIGMDSRGNPWAYDNGIGSYMSYGTGEMCFGTGYARTCC